MIQLYMSDACDFYDSRHQLGVIGQPRQAPHLSIMDPVLKTHLHEYNSALYMSDARDFYDSRDQLGVIGQPCQTPHLPPVLKRH